MKIPDQINKLKINTRNQIKRIARTYLSKKENFLRFGVEASFKAMIEFQRKKNKDHPINNKNLWKEGRENLVILEADKEAKHFLKTHSAEEVEQFIFKNINQGNIDIKDFPKKAQSYYRKKAKQEIEQPVSNQKEFQLQKPQEKNNIPQKDIPKTREEIIEGKMGSIEKFNITLSEYFAEAYIGIPDKRQKAEQQWQEALSKHNDPFYKIYYQELLNRVNIFKSRQRGSKGKDQSKDNDLEL